jgi:hypothetical protein
MCQICPLIKLTGRYQQPLADMQVLWGAVVTFVPIAQILALVVACWAAYHFCNNCSFLQWRGSPWSRGDTHRDPNSWSLGIPMGRATSRGRFIMWSPRPERCRAGAESANVNGDCRACKKKHGKVLGTSLGRDLSDSKRYAASRILALGNGAKRYTCYF